MIVGENIRGTKCPVSGKYGVFCAQCQVCGVGENLWETKGHCMNLSNVVRSANLLRKRVRENFSNIITENVLWD